MSIFDNSQAKYTILIADDDLTSRMILRRVLEGMGHQVVETENGQQAVDIFQTVRPDMVLLDAMMPEMDGFEACRQLRKLPESADTPILLVTALDDRESIKRSFEAGAVDHILKPINWTVLRQRISHLLLMKESEKPQSPGGVKTPFDERTVGLTRALKTELELRRQTEAALQEREASYRNLFTNNPNPMLIYDQETLGFLAVNEIAILNYGYSRDEFLQMQLTDIRPPEDIPLLFKNLAEYDLSTTTPTSSRHRLKDGRIIDVEVTLGLLIFDGRNAGCMLVQDVTERHRIEAALQDSEMRYRLATRATNDVIWDWDLRTNQVKWNETLQTLFGYSEAEIGSDATWSYEHAHPEDRASIIASLDAVINEGKQVWSIEYRFCRHDGHYAFVVERGYVVRNDSGKAIRMIAAMTDISERKRSEELLKSERNLLRALIDNIPDYIFGKDRQGRFTLSNIAHALAAQVSTADALIGKTAFEMFPPDLAAQYDRDDQAIMEADQPLINVERVTLNPDGSKKWVLTTKVPLHDEHGNVTGLVGLSRDITDRKQAEKALAEERNLLLTLLDNVPERIFIKDTQSRFVINNASHRFQLGVGVQDDITGKTDFDFFPSELATQYYDDEQAVVQSDKALIDREEPTIDLAGNQLWLLTTKVPLHDASGTVTGLVGINRDITDRKRAEETLAEERNLLRTLIDNIPDRIFVKDMQSRFVINNAAHRAAIGVGILDDLTGKSDFDFFRADLATQYYESEQVVVQSGKALVDLEEPTVDLAGNQLWLLTTKVPLRDSHGKVTGLVGISRDITEEKRSEDALQKERSLLRTVIDTVPDWIYVKDTQSRFLINNLAHLKLMGAQVQDEVTGKTDLDMFPPEEAAQFMANELAVMRTGQAQFDKEESVFNKEAGHTIWILSTKVPLRDQAGNITGIVGSSRDITERRQMEDTLREHRDHFERLVEERTWELKNANETLQEEITQREMIGLELERRMKFEQLVATISTHFISLASDEIYIGIRRALATMGQYMGANHSYAFLFSENGATVEHTYEWCKESAVSQAEALKILSTNLLERWMERLFDKSDSIYAGSNADILAEEGDSQPWPEWLTLQSLVAVPLIYNGVLVGFLALDLSDPINDRLAETVTVLTNVGRIFVNALENTRSETALHRSEEQLRRITDNMLDIICQTDMNGIIEYASPSCWNVLGYQPSTLLGQPIYSGVHEEDVAQFQEAIETIGKAEYRYRHANGEYLWLETLSNLLFDEHGSIKNIVFASRDITKRKQVDHEIQELNRLKTEFLSTAAHELRTPLTSIRGFSEILLTRQLDDTRQRRYITFISEQSTNLGKIIDDLLDVSRLEAKRQLTLTLELVDMAKLINTEMLPFIETVSTHKFCVELAPNSPHVTADPMRLAQVVKNLISNAVKYSPNGGKVTVWNRILPDYLEFGVVDEGLGMTPEQQTHLFEKFYRADNSNTTISGTGLGLAICKLIVEMHGGYIWAESKSGVGTTFHFTVPLVQNGLANEATTL
ncbi:MAG: PAS domain S-box protein [Chloroflexota bacterium]